MLFEVRLEIIFLNALDGVVAVDLEASFPTPAMSTGHTPVEQAAAISRRFENPLPQAVCVPDTASTYWFQGLNDPTVAPTFAGFADIGLQQDPGLGQPLCSFLSGSTPQGSGARTFHCAAH